LRTLSEQWWNKIETSAKFDKNREKILRYQKSLKPGDITFVGLIAEGAQGLGTGNNGKYLAFLEGTESEVAATKRRSELSQLWSSNSKFSSDYQEFVARYGEDFDAIAEEMKKRFASNRESWLGQNVHFKRGEVYRIAKTDQIFETKNLSESDRNSIVYDGIQSRRSWILYSKGDKEGNRWTNPSDLYIHWSKENVKELQSISTARWQGHKYFLKSGFTWSDTGNHVPLKARIAPMSIFDVKSMRLIPMVDSLTSFVMLAILNSNFLSFFVKRFVNHTSMYQLNDIRQAPIVIPTKDQASCLDALARRAIEAKDFTLKRQDPFPNLVAFCRELVRNQCTAPSYLQPRPQLLLLDSSEQCLAAIELAVQWEVEKLYGVEGMGPFDEF
jgi:hypothetical protein